MVHRAKLFAAGHGSNTLVQLASGARGVTVARSIWHDR